MQVRPLESLDGSDLEPYRTMRWQTEHRRRGLFVAEGAKVVGRLLESPLKVKSVLLPERWLRQLRPTLEKRPDSPVVYVAPKPMLETLTGFSMYQGLLALAEVPPLPSLEHVLSDSRRPGLLVAVDGLSSAENMGAVVRNCAAFGVQYLLVGETCASPYLRRAVRSSMGAVFRLPVVELGDLAGALGRLSHAGIRTVAAHPHSEQLALADADLAGACCLVFGSEGTGLTPRVLGACNQTVTVPMASGVDSLNVACASAVFLYETARKHRAPAGENRALEAKPAS